MKGIYFLLLVFLPLVFTACNPSPKTHDMTEQKSEASNWKTEVATTLERYGHRNWIVVADAAYPQQSNPAIETIVIDATQLEAVAYVNELIEKAGHVDGTIYLDRELEYVPEDLATGVDAYRTELYKLLDGKSVTTPFHEDIIKKLDETANLYNVLILKTDMMIPYTSVFFQLECGYWPADSEQTLRGAIKNDED